jgi:hypothetical protein
MSTSGEMFTIGQLAVVQAVLSRARTVAEVAAAHVAVLDVQIRTLRLRRAVLSTVARHGPTIEETLIMHKLAKLSARERQQIIDDFVDGVFAGADQDGPATGIARGMRRLPAELPDDPAPEQVSAWVELAELVADDDFRQRARSMVLAGQQAAPDGAATGGEAQPDYRTFTERISQATAAGVAPDSTEGQALLDSIVLPPRGGRNSWRSSRRSPTPGWSGTGSCWPSSTASRCRRPWCRRSTG